jgi:hypothetical protein
MAVGQALELIGLSRERYARWRHRLAANTLEDRPGGGRPKAFPPTPGEVEVVLTCAREYPMLGARRLAWFMINVELAGVRPWQVIEILRSNNLLRIREEPAAGALRRPPPPTGPN